MKKFRVQIRDQKHRFYMFCIGFSRFCRGSGSEYRRSVNLISTSGNTRVWGLKPYDSVWGPRGLGFRVRRLGIERK